MNIKDQAEILNELMSTVGAEVKEKPKGHFYYNLHMTKKMYDTDIEVLDLNVRPYHNLKRAGLDTIGKLADYIVTGAGLSRLRNNGKESIREIMFNLFLYQYYSLNQDRREGYLMETAKLNESKKVYEAGQGSITFG